MSRPRLSETFMRIADIMSARSTCLRRKVGAVLVQDKYIISTGYNGAPSRLSHCDKTGCLREKLGIPSGEQLEKCRASHAEANAIIQCALHGVSTKGATMYVTCSPCSGCAKLIINAGIRKVVYKSAYPNQEGITMLQQGGVDVENYTDR